MTAIRDGRAGVSPSLGAWTFAGGARLGVRQRDCRLFSLGIFRLWVAMSLAKAVATLSKSKAATFGPRRRARRHSLVTLSLACAFVALISPSALAQVQAQGRPQLLRDVGIDQKLNGQIPLDLTFRDETGRTVPLAEYFGGKPVVLTLVYYECPMLCTQVLNGLLRSFQSLKFDVGKQFNVVAVSINPREKPDLAKAKQEVYVGLYGRDGAAAQGWHFLTGEESQIQRLAQAVGYRYAYDPETGQYAHASGIMVLTPQGRISKYFYGIQYPPRDLRLGLVEASANKIGSPSDQVLLFCYHYDPTTGKYGLVISNVLKLGGLATVLALGALLLVMFRRERYTAISKEGVRVDGHELQI